MTVRTLLLIVLAGLLVLVTLMVLGAAINRHDDNDYTRVQTTNGMTPTTAWPETQPALGDGFDELLAGVTRTKAAHRPKARTATATITRPATSATIAQLEQIIRDGFARFGADVADQAVDQAWCETAGTLDPNSTGAAGERGLLQIHGRYHMDRIHRLGFTWDQMYEPGPNVAVAVNLYAEQGWAPWTCQP